MDRWQNKTAVVTGASTGIGAAIALALVKEDMIVIGMARTINKIDKLRQTELPDNLKPKLISRYCDVTNEESIIKAFDWVDQNHSGVDVLVNNAGVMCKGLISDAGNSAAVRANIDTNFTGVVFCTRQALLSMDKRKVDGHIININSRLGHQVPSAAEFPPLFNVYNATKFAITGFTDSLRQELDYLCRRTKVTSISPGATATDRVRNQFDEQMLANSMRPEDIAQAVVYALSTPACVEVTELKIKPIKRN